jgi:hypothetical protein
MFKGVEMNSLNRLKLFVCLGLAFAVVPAVAHAGAADSLRVDKSRDNALHPGMWALMFQIDEDIVPKPFEGLGIALKRHWSRKTALRLGFDIGLSVNEDDLESWRSVDDTLQNESDELNKTNGQNVAVELLYMMYPWPDSYINFFWGLGPVISFSRSDQKRDRDAVHYDSGSSRLYRSYYSRSWSAGLKGAAGVEWFATRRISFHMEYQLTLTYRSRYTEMEDINDYYSSEEFRKITSGDWSLQTSTVVVGLSMYF